MRRRLTVAATLALVAAFLLPAAPARAQDYQYGSVQFFPLRFVPSSGVTSIDLACTSLLNCGGGPITNGGGVLTIDYPNYGPGASIMGPITGAAAAPTTRRIVCNDLDAGLLCPSGAFLFVSGGITSWASGVSAHTTIGGVALQSSSPGTQQPGHINVQGIWIEDSGAIGTSNVDGVVVGNATPSTSGVTVQRSPFLHWSATVYDTGTVASKTVDFRCNIQPTSGNPATAKWICGSNAGAGGGYFNSISISVGQNGLWNIGTGAGPIVQWGTTGGTISSAANTLIIADATGTAAGGFCFGNINATNACITRTASVAETNFGKGDGTSNLAAGGRVKFTGGIRIVPQNKTTTYTLTTDDTVVTADATGAAFTITLPAATGTGQMYYVIRTNSAANNVTLSRAGSDTIQGATTVALTAQYQYIQVIDCASALWCKMDGTLGQ